MKTEWIIEFNFRCQSDVRECKRQAGIWLYIFKASMGPCCLSSQSLEAWPSQQETWSWTMQGKCDDHGWGQPEPTGSHPVAAEAQLAGVPSFSGWRRKGTALLGDPLPPVCSILPGEMGTQSSAHLGHFFPTWRMGGDLKACLLTVYVLWFCTLWIKPTI